MRLKRIFPINKNESISNLLVSDKYCKSAIHYYYIFELLCIKKEQP